MNRENCQTFSDRLEYVTQCRTNAHCDEDLRLLFSKYIVNYGDYTDFMVDEIMWRINFISDFHRALLQSLFLAE